MANNAHMAEERNMVDDSGLDEEDRFVLSAIRSMTLAHDALLTLLYYRYGAVIRGPDAYVPPGARKTGPPSTNTPSPSLPQSRATLEPISKRTSPLPLSASSSSSKLAEAPVVDTFRQFVSSEKERLTQKRQDLVKSAVKKEQESRTASLVAFSQNFKVRSPPVCLLVTKSNFLLSIRQLKGPIPADLAEIFGKTSGGKKPPVNSTSTTIPSTASASPALSSTKPTLTSAKSSSKLLTLAEIPPFNARKPKSVPPPTATTPDPAPSKISANAPAFVFRPGANSFTPVRRRVPFFLVLLRSC